MDSISVATFNIHGGVDGWARPFDVVDACRQLDSDVIVIEENLRDIGQPSVADAVADALGYSVIEIPFVAVQLLEPFGPPGESRWGPPGLRPALRAIRYPGGGSPPWRRTTKAERRLRSRTVTMGLAVLVRVDHSAIVVRLPKLVADPSLRSLILLDIPLVTGVIRVAGTHFGHLTHGSPRQMRAVRAVLRNGPPTVFVGDMNCWGPLLCAFVTGMRRAVIGPTWPASHPRHQIDHILVGSDVECFDGKVFPPLGSDHCAVRCAVAIAESAPPRAADDSP